MAGEVGRVLRAAMLREVGGAGDGDALDGAEVAGDQAAVGELADPEHDVVARGDDVDARVVEREFDRDLRVAGEKLREQRRDMGAAEFEGGGEADRAGRDGGRFAEALLHRMGGCDEGLGFAQRFLPEGREREAAGAAVEKGSAEPCLEPGDCARDGGDGEAARAGGGCKAAAFGDRDEEVPGFEIRNNHFQKGCLSIVALF